MNVTLEVGVVPIHLASPAQRMGDWIFKVSAITSEVGAHYARIDSMAPSAVLQDVPAGKYSSTAQRVDLVGNVFGDEVTASFEVPEPTEQSDVLYIEDVPALSGSPMPAVGTGLAAATMTVTLS